MRPGRFASGGARQIGTPLPALRGGPHSGLHSARGRLRNGSALTERDARIAEQVNAYWTDFAKTGNPYGAGRPAWPAYDVRRDEILDFTLDGPVPKPDPWKARLDLAEIANEAAQAAVPKASEAGR